LLAWPFVCLDVACLDVVCCLGLSVLKLVPMSSSVTSDDGSNAYAVFEEGVSHGSILRTRPLQSFPGPPEADLYYLDANYAVILKPHDVRMDTPKHLKEAWGDEERGHTVESLMVPMVPTGTKVTLTLNPKP
jgi:hypothetical protein